MKFRNFFLLAICIIFFGCDQYTLKKSPEFNLKIDKKYNNSGFALLYEESLNIKKLDNRSLQIFHKHLKKKSLVKITNPLNNKTLLAEVKSNKVKFSNFYNSIITDRIIQDLELNVNEPYIEIVLISKDSTFVADKAKTFDQEKEVAEKAPVDSIKITNLNGNLSNNNNQLLNNNFSYSIKVADVYYKKTAELMIDRIQDETTIDDISLIKLSETNYRVLLGPFNDIKSLKESFEKMNSFYFENLEILKNV